jgi:hypothetical protein
MITAAKESRADAKHGDLWRCDDCNRLWAAVAFGYFPGCYWNDEPTRKQRRQAARIERDNAAPAQ